MKFSFGLRFVSAIFGMVATCLASASAEPAPQPSGSLAALRFDVREGLNINSLLREGDVAAHLVLRSGVEPRILIAFPAGNSADGVWFAHLPHGAKWTLQGAPSPVREVDGRGRPLRGIAAVVSINAAELQVRQGVVSSTRVLRDFQGTGTVPPQLQSDAQIGGQKLVWSRDRLDGAAGYRLTLEVIHGRLVNGQMRAGPDGRIGLRVTGLTGETPLVPLPEAQLLSERAGRDPAARHTLTFLAYQEKFLAGSWRFDTYFGRDTLLSVRLLMPVLTPAAVEAGIASVLTRLSSHGEVAHEEDVGERAILDHMQSDGSRSDAPVFDYKMIDGNYLLAPVAVAWLLDDARGRARAAAFLAAPVGNGAAAGSVTETRGAALASNLRLVLQSAAPFAQEPSRAHLVSLKSGIAVGQWRDSEDGLGGGRYPYDVNAVLVPAALDAAARLQASGLLQPYLTAADRESFGRAAGMADSWRRQAAPLFDVTLPATQAATAIQAYASSQHVASQAALRALGDGDLRFHALALDAAGRPIPVMHSDEGFMLLFQNPDAANLEQAVSTLLRPFPAGLLTDIGMLVANPAFGTPALQSRFSRNAYHGTVVWSWQQALFAAGLERQLRRSDLSPEVRAHLQQSQRALWTAIAATQAQRNSELWSWSFSATHYRLAAFGAAAADADESNVAQLWSTVYLAVHPPAGLSAPQDKR